MPDLSIIIVNFNTGDHLKKCVDSIIKTTNSLTLPTSEILIIDNNSKDDSISKISKIKNVKVLNNSQNRGFSKAVNQGTNEANGKYILLLNPDTIVKPHAIQKLVSFARGHQETGVIGARLLDADGSIQASTIPFPTITSAIQQYWLGQKNKYSKYKIRSQSAQIVDSVVGAAFLITPQALKRVGKLDEKFFMYYEDIDYCKRVWEQGLKVYYLPEAEVIHYHGVSGKNIANNSHQWKRLIPSSIAYHGLLTHYALWFILWTGQKLQQLFKKN